MKRIFTICLSLLLLCFTANVYSHSGRVDDNGGHVEKSTGEYHCHNPDCIIPINATTYFAPEKIRIATFNIQIFGKTKLKKPAVMVELSSIVRKYDLVAIQEIKDVSGSVAPKFLEVINIDGAKYDYIISERTGRNPDDASSQEQYAYFYNTQTVAPSDIGSLYDDSKDDYFQREPYIAHFNVVGGSFDFTIITIHTRPESALDEIASLEHVISWVHAKYPDEDDVITLGDFNASCDYASDDDLDDLAIHGDNYIWAVPHSADTNFSSSTSCAYDRIVLNNSLEQDFTGDWGIGTVSGKQVSDHFPVWAEFYTTRD